MGGPHAARVGRDRLTQPTCLLTAATTTPQRWQRHLQLARQIRSRQCRLRSTGWSG